MNWLEKGCVRAAPAFKRRTPKHDMINGMLRHGHLSHRCASQATVTVTKVLYTTEEASTASLEAFSSQETHYRFRPSVLLPFAACASSSFGKVLQAVSPQVGQAYAAGIKLAISDYYNDQIREIYADMADDPEALPLKELFKSLRDAELDDVEQLFPSIEAAKENQVAQYAKTITQVLLQPGAHL
ncbi:unnamed protein product [Aphanomyces euteiches]|uniref:Uncharacterized protein n=1 Tax=Aphanomyces euteiches TaxID=100861 RepID=A0A6G0WKB7_9STRA|nr:hypothetical protein Ae201684_014305 [Aphanomyces euteiches]KAH9069023.1 hypothetical protein Ae201684P_004720 [Aphanomyces euteiches]KAH9137885.1 hypothetical protein AeRB84_017593 [Aphanomyces euteiches]